MAAPRRLPPVEELERLVALHTYEEVGQMYGVGRSAVYRALSRANRIKKAPDYRDVVPWAVEEQHRGAGVMRRIRELVKKQQGIPLSTAEERLLNEWIEGMLKEGVILNYHPEAPPNAAASTGGFYYSPRREGEEGLFRSPDPDED